EQAAIRHDLALIGDTLRWMLESCASAGAETLRSELDFALRSHQRDTSTLRELAALRENEFDGNVIRLGRDQAARPPEPLRTRVATEDDDDGSATRETEELAVRIWPRDAAARQPTMRAVNDSLPEVLQRAQHAGR